jgi:hypothetical protein
VRRAFDRGIAGNIVSKSLLSTVFRARFAGFLRHRGSAEIATGFHGSGRSYDARCRQFYAIARQSRKRDNRRNAAVSGRLAEDVDAYLKYWHDSGDKIIKFLRIDRARLGGPAESRERFLRMIRVPGAEQPNVIFTMTLNGEAIGYTNLNRHAETRSDGLWR